MRKQLDNVKMALRTKAVAYPKIQEFCLHNGWAFVIIEEESAERKTVFPERRLE